MSDRVASFALHLVYTGKELDMKHACNGFPNERTAKVCSQCHGFAGEWHAPDCTADASEWTDDGRVRAS